MRISGVKTKQGADGAWYVVGFNNISEYVVSGPYNNEKDADSSFDDILNEGESVLKKHEDELISFNKRLN